jgi:hypothetical protein
MGLLDRARGYVAKGFSVIPIKSHDKKPAINSWEKYQKQHATDEELVSWFTNDDLNIALITGEISGVDVVDVDSYKGKEAGIVISSPLRVNTPRGGKHYYFKHVEGVKPGVNSEMGVDLRGDGSYVLLPPSKGPNNVEYAWEKDGEINLATLPPIPADIVNKIKKTEEVSQGFNLADAIDVSQGSRNDTLHKAAVSLLRKNPRDIAWGLVLRLNDTFQPPLSEREVQTLFRSAETFISRNPPITQNSNKVNEAEENPGWREPTLAEDLEMVKKYIREGKQAGYPTGYPEMDAITNGLLPGQSYLVFGDTNTGKSLFVLNILVYLAKNDIKCLYFDLENSITMTTEREVLILEDGRLNKQTWDLAVRERKADEFIDRLENYPLRVYDITKMDARFGQITYPAVETVMKEAVAKGVQVIAIDHLHYFDPSQQDFNYLANISRKINDFCAKYGVVVIVVAHTKKGLMKVKNDKIKTERPTLDSVAGSGLISKHTKNVIGLRRNYASSSEDDQRQTWVYVDKTKSGPSGQFQLEFDPSCLRFRGSNYAYNPMEVFKTVETATKTETELDKIEDIM